VLQPLRVVALREIGAVVGAAAFLARIRRDHRRARHLDQVLELERLDPGRIEDLRLVLDLRALRALGDRLDLVDALREEIRKAEDTAVRLHRALHLAADIRDFLPAALRIKTIHPRHRVVARVLGQIAMLRRAPQVLDHRHAGALAHHEEVRERIGPEAVRAVDRGAAALPRRVETVNDARVR
jgi:hypothetical protein